MIILTGGFPWILLIQEYQEYVDMEKRLLEELGIKEEDEDPLEV